MANDRNEFKEQQEKLRAQGDRIAQGAQMSDEYKSIEVRYFLPETEIKKKEDLLVEYLDIMDMAEEVG